MNETKLTEYGHKPLFQAGICMVVFLVLLAMGEATRGETETHRFPWVAALSSLFLFTVINSIISLSDETPKQYRLESVLGFLVLAVLPGLIAWKVSGLDLRDNISHKVIYAVLIFFYLVFLSIMGFIKRLVVFFDAEEAQTRSNHQKNKRPGRYL